MTLVFLHDFIVRLCVDYFSTDVETSGPAPGIHNLLSVGITHVRRFGGRYELFEDFYIEIRPVFPAFEDAAMAVHKLDAERLRREGVPPKDAMARIANWVGRQQKAKHDRPIFVAHNAPFDWMFIAWYFAWSEIQNPFGHSALDIKALAMGRMGVSWNETSLKQVAARLGSLPERDLTLLHHAGHDARYQALVFQCLMNHEDGAFKGRGTDVT